MPATRPTPSSQTPLPEPPYYIEAATKNVEAYLEGVGERLRGKVRAVTPFASGYKPELDSSDLLGSVEATKYQDLI